MGDQEIASSRAILKRLAPPSSTTEEASHNQKVIPYLVKVEQAQAIYDALVKLSEDYSKEPYLREQQVAGSFNLILAYVNAEKIKKPCLFTMHLKSRLSAV